MKFNPERHHRQSLRIKTRDYSRDGFYFVTICAHNRENLFASLCVGAGLAPALDHGHPLGVPLQQKMAPALDHGHPLGVPLQQKMAPAQDPSSNLILTTAGQIIEKNWHKIATPTVKTDAFVIMPNHIHGIVIIKPHAFCVGAGLAPAPTPNLGSIIGAFKSRCAMDYLKYIDDNNLNESAKIWQRNYYEHIIRDRKELAAIRNYIKSNPANWAMDEENPLNL